MNEATGGGRRDGQDAGKSSCPGQGAHGGRSASARTRPRRPAGSPPRPCRRCARPASTASCSLRGTAAPRRIIPGMVDIVEAISIACSAAGWCLVQYSSHNCLLGYWPPEGQDEIWGTTPDAMVAGVLIPACGRAVRRGRRLAYQRDAGRSRAESMAPTGSSPPPSPKTADKPRLAQMHAIPRGEYEIIDTWHTAGLRGHRQRRRRRG